MVRRWREPESVLEDNDVPVTSSAGKPVKVAVMTRGMMACLVVLVAGAGWLAEGSARQDKPEPEEPARLELERISRGITIASAFSPDGKTLATSHGDGTLRLWDVAAGRSRSTLRAASGRSIAYTPDGKTFAVADSSSTVRFYDTQSCEEQGTLKASRRIRAVAFAPGEQGRTLASANVDGTVTFWNVTTRKATRTLTGHALPPEFPEFPPLIGCFAYAPDGSSLATGGRDGVVKTWDTSTGRCERTFKAHDLSVVHLAYSPDGQTLASAGCFDGVVKLWDVKSDREPLKLAGASRTVSSIAFASDGTTVATAGAEREIRLWEIPSGRELPSLRGETDQLWTVTFSPDGGLLASGAANGTVQFWDKAQIGEHRSLRSTFVEPVETE